MMSRTRRSKLQFASLVVFCVAAITVWGVTRSSGNAGVAEDITASFTDVTAVENAAQMDYSHFKHTNDAHTRLPCLLCHKRDGGTARFRMPGNINHEPCAGCHQVQFQDTSSGICTICHTGGAGGPVKMLPGMQDFTSRFNHGRHQRQANCATCHTPNRRGVGYSVPQSWNAHTTCFRCHTASSPIGSCDTCHVGGRPVRNNDNARAYSVTPFNHSEHVRGANLNCANCHSVQAGSAKGRQVTAPVAAQHFPPAGSTSCATCHNNKRAFGPPDFADCKRCHDKGNSFRF